MDLPYSDLYRQLLFRQQREQTILSNKNLEPSDRILLVELERMYPKISTQLTPVQVWKLAVYAGTRPETVSRFLTAMYEQGYIEYRRDTQSAIVDGKVAYQSSVLVKELSACKEPGTLTTKNTPRRAKKREQDKLRKQCTSCGGKLVKQVICVTCGEVQ